MEELEETPIPATVAARGWEGYVRRPCNANINIVKEFYANMVDAQFGTHSVVVVRGVPVVLSVEAIRDYYGLQPHEDVQVAFPGKYEIGCALCREGGASWNGQELKRGDLYLDIAFWNLFISASLKPSSHTGEIFKEVSHVCYQDR